MIKVLSKSREESTSDAVRDMDDEYQTPTALNATSNTFTTVFTTRQLLRSEPTMS